jgi:hypothetical protein
MNGRALLALAVALIASTATAQSPTLPVGTIGEPEHHIGIVHHDIADSSPVASATISAEQKPFKAGTKVNIHFVLENRSDHDIVLPPNGGVVMDVRDASGALPPETDLGCVVHYFSPCHKYKYLYQAPGPVIPAHKKFEMSGPLSDYVLSQPGVYTVVGYVRTPDEDPEYFKTNTIKITVE